MRHLLFQVETAVPLVLLDEGQGFELFACSFRPAQEIARPRGLISCREKAAIAFQQFCSVGLSLVKAGHFMPEALRATLKDRTACSRILAREDVLS